MRNFVYTLTFLSFLFLNCCAQKENAQDRPLKAPRGYMNETFIKIAYGLGMLDLIDTKPSVPDDISVFGNIAYKRLDSIDLKLDIYKRKDLLSKAPALVFIHGGAWRKGKRSDYLPYLLDYANKGFVTITVSYRLSNVSVFPAAFQDVKCAIQWIRSNAEVYGIDPDRIALLGGSAGGHLALMVGYASDQAELSGGCADTVSSRVKAIIDLYGPVDLTTDYAKGKSEVTSFLGTTYDEDPEIFRIASPRSYITQDDPPTLIFQGTIDSLVPVSQSDSLDLWLTQAGVNHEYHRLKGWPHTMDVSKKVNAYCQFYIDRFLEKYL